MKTYLAVALAATLSQPASAITFPSLTTIYVASGVYDDGAADFTGVATTVLCSNVSGQTATIRLLFLSNTGAVAGQTTEPVEHGVTMAVSTHGTAFAGSFLTMPFITQGVLNVESTQSGVFCTAFIVEAAGPVSNSAPLHMVRVNPHPGTVE